jgi:hypothetical protein
MSEAPSGIAIPRTAGKYRRIDNRWARLILVPAVGFLMTGILHTIASYLLSSIGSSIGFHHHPWSRDPGAWTEIMFPLLKFSELLGPWILGFDGMLLLSRIAALHFYLDS